MNKERKGVKGGGKEKKERERKASGKVDQR